MKNIYSFIVCVFLAVTAAAAELNLTATMASFGKKDGKITLAITGGVGPYSIAWTGPGGYSSSKLNPDSLVAGNYCVTVTDQYCGIAKTCITVAEKTNAIKEFAAQKINVYPNPFSNQLNIHLDKYYSGNGKITLYDQAGRQLAAKEIIVAQQIRWDLETPLADGIYTLTIIFPDGTNLSTKLSSISK